MYDLLNVLQWMVFGTTGWNGPNVRTRVGTAIGIGLEPVRVPSMRALCVRVVQMR